jgi:hypothetical protein
MTCDNDNCACLITRRYLLGPYDQPLIVVIECPCGDQAGDRSCAVRFLEVGDVNFEMLTDSEKTLYKLPAGETSVLEVKEIQRGSYAVEITQLPTKVALQKPGPFPPVGECLGSCPPYSKECRPDQHPDCSSGTLKCEPP